MSRSVRFHVTGGPEVLVLEETPIPRPGPEEVLIRTRALGLNRAGVMFRRDQYVVSPVPPSLIGYEAAGEIQAVGLAVEGLTIGEAVSVVPAFAMTQYGVHGEFVLAPAHAVVKHPPSLSWEEAASVWMMFITAYGGLIDLARLRDGDTLLVPAASSSVGLAAIQIARMVGARPIALTRTRAKRQRLLDAGAEAVIVTAEDHLVPGVREITRGEGARVVFDPVGGPRVAELVAAMAPHGIFVLYGALSPEPAPLPVMDVLARHLTIRGFEIFELTLDHERRQAAVDFVQGGIIRGALNPVIDRTFPLDAIVDAHCYLESGSQVGKIVVTV